MTRRQGARRGGFIGLCCAGLALLPIAAHATIITRQIGNNSFETAQNLDAYFSLDFSPDVGDVQVPNNNTSLAIPHATVLGVSSDRELISSDYYSFTVETPNSQVYLDIDDPFGWSPDDPSHGGQFVDSALWLYDSYGTQLAHNDDSNAAVGGLGSHTHLDAFLHMTLNPALYYIRVSSFTGLLNDGAYTLQVSVANHAVPEPGTLSLFGLAFAVLGVVRRRRSVLSDLEVPARRARW